MQSPVEPADSEPLLPIDDLRDALTRPREMPEAGKPSAKRAAVAILLRAAAEARGGPEVLLMTRALRADDLWSGQVSLPGGHVDPQDADLRAAAVRETREELGFDLDQVARDLGALPPQRAGARRKLLPLWVHPVLFEGQLEPEIVPGPEASDAFWFPLAAAAAGRLNGEFIWREGEQRWSFPCWRLEQRVVWGLTYRLLSDLLAVWKR